MSLKKQSKIIEVKVIARASCCQVIPLTDITFKVKLTRPALEGQANDQLCMLLAKHFNTSKSNIKILSGERCSNKRIEVINDILTEKI